PQLLMIIDEVISFLAVTDHDESGTFYILEGIEELEQPPALLHTALIQHDFLRVRDFEFLSDRIGFHCYYIIELRIIVYRCRTLFILSSMIIRPCIILDVDMLDEL